MRIDPKKGQAGFTLVEVLVSFAILEIAAGALLSVFSSGPEKMLRASNARMNILSAKSILSLVGNELPLKPGEYHGQMHDKMRWMLSIQPYEDAGFKGQDFPITKPYLVTVSALEGEKVAATITTIRLGVTAHE